MFYNKPIFRLLKLSMPLVAILLFSQNAAAQDVTNVDAYQEGKSIAVTYDLKIPAKISLYYTQDGGRTVTSIPTRFLEGDVGAKVTSGTGKKILWHVLEQNENQDFRGENLSFIVKSSMRPRFFATANAGYSLDSGPIAGFTVGQMADIGWYVRAMTTFSLPKSAAFECDANGYINGTLPAYSGKAAKSKAYGVAGAIFRVGGQMYLNAGLGYGSRVYDWELMDSRWVKNTGGSYTGIAIDAGMMTYLDNIVLSAAATMISGKIDFNLGVGYLF